MSQTVSRIEWLVLDNALHARPPSHGFKAMPTNLGGALITLRKRGLIVSSGTGGIFLLTNDGIAVHKAHAGKYEAK